MGFPQRACQVDLRSKVKHDWIVCIEGIEDIGRWAEISRRMGGRAAAKGWIEALDGEGEHGIDSERKDRLDSRRAEEEAIRRYWEGWRSPKTQKHSGCTNLCFK